MMDNTKKDIRQEDNETVVSEQEGKEQAKTEESENVDHESMQEQLQACQQELEQYKDRYLRVASDFQNYKQRMEKDRSTWTSQAQADVLGGLLAICDDFDRALEQEVESGSDLSAWRDGFIMIQQALHKLLTKFDVSPIEQMTTFDPELHEALMQTESADHEPGQIVQVFQKGFMHKKQVLRPAKVSVAQD